MALNVLSLGGSRNIGYFTCLRLLDAGATVSFVLRSPANLDTDETIQKYVQSGHARLIKGDALVETDLRRAWEEAGKDRPVDLLLFTVGGQLQFSLTKGAFIHPPNLVTQSLLNTLSTIPKSAPEPCITVISSIGITHSSHAKLPLLMKPVYSHLLASPHADKFGAERILSHVCGRPWDPTEDGEPAEDIMGPDWMNKAGLPAHGSLKKVLVVRPAFLTDGDCKAEKRQSGDGKAPYRVSEEELGGYVVSRKDVAHFIAETALHNWDAYENKVINVGY